MNDIERNDYYQNSSAGLTLSAFLGTVALFFAGLLITQINSFNDNIRLPIVYLICCTVALIYSAIVYANMTGEVVTGSKGHAKQSNYFANMISELLGVNIFMISMPLVINAITTDILIRITVSVVILMSLAIYTTSSFSILSRICTKPGLTVTALLVSGWGALLLYAQTNFHQDFIALGLCSFACYLLWTISRLYIGADRLK